MNPQFLMVFIPVIVILFVVAGVINRRFPRKRNPELQRRDDLAGVAQNLGLQFSPDVDFKFAESWAFLSCLNRCQVRSTSNRLEGIYDGFSLIIFDYYCDSYYWSAYILNLETNFPDTIIWPETTAVKLFEKLGESHITFESSAFSRAFNVRSADKKFAFDVCSQPMMDYLLANRDLFIEINRGTLLLFFETWLHPEKVESNLARLVQIRKLLPEYLFTS